MQQLSIFNIEEHAWHAWIGAHTAEWRYGHLNTQSNEWIWPQVNNWCTRRIRLHLSKLFLKSWTRHFPTIRLRCFHLDVNSSSSPAGTANWYVDIYIWQSDWWLLWQLQYDSYSVTRSSLWHQLPFSTTEECLRRDKRHASLLSCETWKVGFLAVRYVISGSCFVTSALMWPQDHEFLSTGLTVWSAAMSASQSLVQSSLF